MSRLDGDDGSLPEFASIAVCFFFVSLKVTCFSFSDHWFLSGSWTCTIDDTQTLEETARLARCERAATNTAGLG